MQVLRLTVSLPVSILMTDLLFQTFLAVFAVFAACNGKEVNGKLSTCTI
jgi:hypothetical protein